MSRTDYKCVICGKVMSPYSVYERHMKRHIREEGAEYVRQRLQAHRATHKR